MSDLLEPLFGEAGARVAQFVITVVVVLGLIALAYWVVRRFAGFGIGGIGRGRVPRLAVVDAVAIDSRRRLVLVRRDTVEHLLLLGGPSDLVVEPTIVRTRRRATPAEAAQRAAAQPAASAPPPAARGPETAPPAAAAPIPFPAARPSVRPETGEPGFQPLQRSGVAPPDLPMNHGNPPTPARLVEMQQLPFRSVQAPTAAEPSPPEPFLPEVIRPEGMNGEARNMASPARVHEPVRAEPASASADQTNLDLGDQTASSALPASFGGHAPAGGEGDTAAKVSHLEQEMARLLGEITAGRPSS